MKFAEIKKHLSSNQYTWLVTGVAGFIGSNILEELLRLKQKVIGIDNFATGFQQNLTEVLATVNGDFQFHEIDIRDLKACEKVTKNVDFVLHQAALGSVPRSIETPEITTGVNVDGFVNILIAAQKANVKRFVYASSSSVYGDSPKSPKVENVIGKSLSPYAASKLTNEIYAQAFANSYGIKTIGLRYFNVFGPRQDPNGPYAAVIPKWTAAMQNNSDVYIYGDGTTSRDFCYIDNVVQANILAAMSDDNATNEVYNIAVGEKTSLNELFAYIKKYAKAESSLTPTYKDFRPGDIKHSLADISKAKKLLGYEPSVKIESGLKNAMDWYFGKLNNG